MKECYSGDKVAQGGPEENMKKANQRTICLHWQKTCESVNGE